MLYQQKDIFHNQMGPPTEEEFYKQTYSAGKGGGLTAEQGAELGTAAANALIQLAPLLKGSDAKQAFKQEMKQACGRKPIFMGKRTEWYRCQHDYIKKKRENLLAQQQAQAIAQEQISSNEKKFEIPLAVQIIGGIVLAGGVIWVTNKLI